MCDVTREDKIQFISDVYKDAHGFRPRHIDFDAMSDDELGVFADKCIAEAEAEEKRQEAIQQEHVDEFEARVLKTMYEGANTRERAIHWILDGMNEEAYDADYYCYLLGVGYSYAAEFQPILNKIYNYRHAEEQLASALYEEYAQ